MFVKLAWWLPECTQVWYAHVACSGEKPFIGFIVIIGIQTPKNNKRPWSSSLKHVQWWFPRSGLYCKVSSLRTISCLEVPILQFHGIGGTWIHLFFQERGICGVNDIQFLQVEFSWVWHHHTQDHLDVSSCTQAHSISCLNEHQ